MSDKKKILIIQNIHQTGLQLIKNNPKYEFEITDDTNLDNLKKKIIDCDAISIRTAKLPSEVIEQGKKLKIISRHGVGYDNIDLNSSKKNNITNYTIINSCAVTQEAEKKVCYEIRKAKRKFPSKKIKFLGRLNSSLTLARGSILSRLVKSSRVSLFFMFI
mgnify:CR=1 FL=1